MRIFNDVVLSSTITSTTNSDPIQLDHLYGYSVQVSYDVNTPTDQDFEDADVSVLNNTVSVASHGFTTGLAVTLTTTGVLPDGLAEATTYYLIVVNSNTFQFAATLADALAGTEVDITAAAGGGTH